MLNTEFPFLNVDLPSPHTDLSIMSRHTNFQHVDIWSGREKYEVFAAGCGISIISRIYTGE